MCYHVSQEKAGEQLKAEFEKPIKNEEHLKNAYHVNGFERPYVPVIATDAPQYIEMCRWKLIPAGIRDENKYRANTLNARNDLLFDTPAYRDYWENRCLVICSGFFEPHTVLGKKKTESWYIKPNNKEFFTLGGIYSYWRGHKTISIITTDASPLLAQIHNDGKRMPLILDGENADAWLLPDLTKQEMTLLMAPFCDDSLLSSYRVIDNITNALVDTNYPEAILPYHHVEPPISDLPLFANF